MKSEASNEPEFIGHYRVLRKLGAGGMGEVYLATDTKLDRQVALKVLPADVTGDVDRRKRFLAEARAASALNHHHVCVIHEVNETSDLRFYIAMEYVEGPTLAERARERQIASDEIVAIAIQISDALDAAHAKGIVHRDLKPSNISINARGLVKVLDFGLAKRLEEATDAGSNPDASTVLQTQPDRILGTPAYMSPEQSMGGTLDHRTDLFSLGTVLYELIAGRLPFGGESLVETIHRIGHAQPEALARFNYDVPPELDRIVRKLLEKDPARRYQTPRELSVDLKNLQRDRASAFAGRESDGVGGLTAVRENGRVPTGIRGVLGSCGTHRHLVRGSTIPHFQGAQDAPRCPGYSAVARHALFAIARVRILRTRPGFGPVTGI